jgi:RNA polymerase sigma-B factor
MVPLCNEPFDDLVQIGSIGLVKAVERFDPRQNLKLSTLAARWIRGEILHYLRDKGSTVRIPNSFRELYAKARRYQAQRECVEYLQAYQVATHLGITEDEWREIKEAIEQQQCRELSEIFNYSDEQSDEPFYRRDYVEANDAEAAALQVQKYLKAIYAELNRISEPGKTVIWMLFQEQCTKKYIARVMNTSTRSIDLIISSALKELTSKINGNQSTATLRCDTKYSA